MSPTSTNQAGSSAQEEGARMTIERYHKFLKIKYKRLKKNRIYMCGETHKFKKKEEVVRKTTREKLDDAKAKKEEVAKWTEDCTVKHEEVESLKPDWEKVRKEISNGEEPENIDIRKKLEEKRASNNNLKACVKAIKTSKMKHKMKILARENFVRFINFRREIARRLQGTSSVQPGIAPKVKYSEPVQGTSKDLQAKKKKGFDLPEVKKQWPSASSSEAARPNPQAFGVSKKQTGPCMNVLNTNATSPSDNRKTRPEYASEQSDTEDSSDSWEISVPITAQMAIKVCRVCIPCLPPDVEEEDNTMPVLKKMNLCTVEEISQEQVRLISIKQEVGEHEILEPMSRIKIKEEVGEHEILEPMSLISIKEEVEEEEMLEPLSIENIKQEILDPVSLENIKQEVEQNLLPNPEYTGRGRRSRRKKKRSSKI